MLVFRAAMIAAIAATPSIAAAQAVRVDWDPVKLTTTILTTCNIDNAMFRVEKDFDGRAHVEQSPTLPAPMVECARQGIEDAHVTLRGSTPTAPRLTDQLASDTTNHPLPRPVPKPKQCITAGTGFNRWSYKLLCKTGEATH
jgi:hypothetical protein